jgi:hypothetical protein
MYILQQKEKENKYKLRKRWLKVTIAALALLLALDLHFLNANFCSLGLSRKLDLLAGRIKLRVERLC